MSPTHYAVGMTAGTKSSAVIILAEDALAAALMAKAHHPDAAITYVRKRNSRGDRRHPQPRES